MTDPIFVGDVDNFASRVRDIVGSPANRPILDAVTRLKLCLEKGRWCHNERLYLIIGHFKLTSASGGLVKRGMMMLAT
jgi:hypothetical protein